MRVLYADPGLRDNRGHHANYCRAIRGELERRGIAVSVLSFVGITPELQVELKAIPLFRVFTYWQTDGDPVCGWLNAFDTAARATQEDLARLRGITADDVLYLNNAQPPQFLGLVKWWQSLAREQRPHAVLEFCTEPGVDVEPSGQPGALELRLRDYRTDPRAMLYRFAARHLEDQDMPRFHLRTLERGISAVYAALLQRPVGVLPSPQSAQIAVTSRAARYPITVSVLGHQRPDKGYHLMPRVARMMLTDVPDIRLLVHNGAPDEMRQVQEELRVHATAESRLTLNEQTAGPELWAELLARSDLVLCPYDPAVFAARTSGVMSDAISLGIPVVVPAATALARLFMSFGEPGTVFDRYEPSSIVAATRQALANFDVIAGRAVAAAEQWKASMGVGNMVSALLSCRDTT
jgi:glycosyltransferase involved in cell wall biosynthesis